MSSANVTTATMNGDLVDQLRSAYGADLQRFLVRRLGQHDLAEDIAQETWLQFQRLQPEQILYPQRLLFSMASKLASKRQQRARREPLVDAAPDEAEAIEDQALLPERQVEMEQSMEVLAELVERLPKRLKVVFVMRYIDQMPYQEIAARLELTTSAIEKRLNKALAYCQSRLQAFGIGYPRTFE